MLNNIKQEIERIAGEAKEIAAQKAKAAKDAREAWEKNQKAEDAKRAAQNAELAQRAKKLEEERAQRDAKFKEFNDKNQRDLNQPGMKLPGNTPNFLALIQMVRCRIQNGEDLEYNKEFLKRLSEDFERAKISIQQEYARKKHPDTQRVLGLLNRQEVANKYYQNAKELNQKVQAQEQAQKLELQKAQTAQEAQKAKEAPLMRRFEADIKDPKKRYVNPAGECDYDKMILDTSESAYKNYIAAKKAEEVALLESRLAEGVSYYPGNFAFIKRRIAELKGASRAELDRLGKEFERVRDSETQALKAANAAETEKKMKEVRQRQERAAQAERAAKERDQARRREQTEQNEYDEFTIQYLAEIQAPGMQALGIGAWEKVVNNARQRAKAETNPVAKAKKLRYLKFVEDQKKAAWNAFLKHL